MSTSDKVLEILQLDYHEARDDERYFLALQGTVIAVALTGVSLLGALANEVAKGTKVPAPLIAGAPLIILCILAFGQAIGALAVLRSFYMRSLEREISDRLALNADLSAYEGLRPLTYVELMVSYSTIATGKRFGRFMAVFIFASLWAIFGGLTLFLALRVSPPWQIAMIVVYGGGAAFIFSDTMRVNVSGRSFFGRHVRMARQRRDEPLQPNREPDTATRALGKYLLLPRPDDLVKGLFVVAGIFVASVSATHAASPGPGAAAMVFFVLAIEWLIYQSRYQWNDIRGLNEDEMAPSKVGRRRLPGGSASIPTSLLVMCIRIIAVVWVAALAWPGEARITHTDQVMLLAIPMIYLVGVLYEEIRRSARQAQTSSMTNLVLTVVVVGFGYPIRFVLGWWAAAGTQWSIELALFLVAVWGLGILFVSLTWILEFADYVHSAADDSESRYFVSPAIGMKPHLLALARVCGIVHSVSATRGPVLVDGGDLQIIPKIRFAPWSPWIVGSMIWYLCVSISIDDLLTLPDFELAPWGIAAAVVVALPVRWRGGLLPHVGAGIALTAGVMWNLWEAWLRDQPPAGSPASIAILSAASVLATLLFITFYLSSYRSTRGMARNLVRLFAAAWRRFARWFIGRSPRPVRSRAPDGSAAVPRNAEQQADARRP